MSGFNPTPTPIRRSLAAYRSLTTPQAAPSSPTPPAPTITAQNLPFDPVYEQTVSNNTQRLNDTNASILNSRNSALTSAGYIDNGNGNFALDPSNPFSRAQLLQRHYDQSVAGTTNSLNASGQLYSGALQNAQNANRFDFDQGTNANLSDLQSQLQALTGRRTGAAADTADANTSAPGTAIGNAQSQANANRDGNAQQDADIIQAATPASGFTHVNQTPGSPRFGQSYNETRDSRGRTVHVYADGHRETLT